MLQSIVGVPEEKEFERDVYYTYTIQCSRRGE